MSGSKGCTNLYQILSQGEEAPNELVNELLEEAIAKRAGQSDVNCRIIFILLSNSYCSTNICL